MAKRINVKNHYTLEEWQKLIVKNQNLDVRFRMLAIERVLANPDISSDEICLGLYISKQTFFRWLGWYNKGGLARLIAGEGGKGSKNKDRKIYSDEAL